MYYTFFIKRNDVKTHVFIDPEKEDIYLHHYSLLHWNEKIPLNAKMVKKYKNRKLICWTDAISFNTWWRITSNLAEIERELEERTKDS